MGINTGNYAGVTGVMLQPASIVDSRYKFDINLFSIGTNFSNNYLQVNRKALLKFNGNNFSDYKTFKSKYLSETALGPNDRAWFDVNSRIQMPLSFMATLNKKSAIALNIQSRSMVQGRNITQQLASMAYNEFYYPPLNNQPIDASGFTLNTLSWVDVGLTYGRVLMESNKHFLKAAFTAKYIGGVASLYMGSNDLSISVNNDSSINFNTSSYQYARNGKADFNIFDRNLKPDASSIGFNAGIVYEFRGNIEKFKYLTAGKDEKSYEATRRDVNKYLFKVGVSLLDAGMFNFDKAATVNNFSGSTTNWQLNNANYNSIKEFDTALNNRTTPLGDNPRSYKVHLPTALSVQLDVRLLRGVYLNAMAYRPVDLSNDDGYRFDNYGFYAITPRWEGRHFGLYIPYTFTNHKNITDYKQNLLGATVRMGPVFVGSSNLGTMIFNKNLKAADVHAGIKVGITYGKPNKTSMLIEKLIKKNVDTLAYRQVVVDTTVITIDTVKVKVTSVTPKVLPLIIDYKEGKVYSDPEQKGNIIIINNNTYYYNKLNGGDSIVTEKIMMQIPKDSATVLLRTDSTIQAKKVTLKKIDSTQKILTDSLNRKKTQLDILIKNLEKLRKEMDDSSKAIIIIDSANMLNSNLARGTVTTVVSDTTLTVNDTTTITTTVTNKVPLVDTSSIEKVNGNHELKKKFLQRT